MNINQNGMIIYEGPSELDGAPIVAIATGFTKQSANTKTGGELIQTWILRSDMSPQEALNNSADESICGDCKHRGEVIDGKNANRPCYVNIAHAPRAVYECFKRGGYRKAKPTELSSIFAGLGVRLGSYGDPAAVPLYVWDNALNEAKFNTGYTHQWQTADIGYAKHCMASVDTAAERAMASAMGYRTFRVRHIDDAILGREIMCPASKEAGEKTTCDQCKACGGTGSKALVDIVIAVHGGASKIKAHNLSL
jgi:hypothetical protein